MCTVTYLPLGNNNFILTSNRDETPFRKTIPPQKYVENGVELTYPKDEVAGGTWIGKSEKNRVVCLLNGGFQIHQRKENYKTSRGLIVKQLLVAENAVAFIQQFDFSEIEPFTLVLIDWKSNILAAHELVWDGENTHFSKLEEQPKIWSSSTLYTQKMKQMRQNWFNDWLLKNEEYQQENILEFHQNTSNGTPETSLKMKRKNVETVSVTSFKKENTKHGFKYVDFVTS